MKLFLTISSFLVAVLTCSLYSQSDFYDNVDLTRISAHYNGSAYNGSNIIVYGEAGSILRSEDGGNSWTKVQLNDSMNIIGIESNGNKFFGLCNNGFGISSDDGGKTWESELLGKGSAFEQFKKEGGRFFSLQRGKLLEIDSDFKTIKEFDFSDNSDMPNFSVSGDLAVCASDTGKITFIDLKTGDLKLISLSEAGIEFASNFCPHNLTLINKDSSLYFSLNNFCCKYDLKSKKAKTVMNMTNSSSYSLTRNDDELYCIFSNTMQTIYGVDVVSTRLDSLYFLKITGDVGNITRISAPEIDRHIYDLSIMRVSFLTKDTIIAVGKHDLIYMSHDGGVHWELKSNSGPYYAVQLLDEKEIRAFGAGGRFFYSHDGGATWLPTKNYRLSIASSILSEIPDLEGGSYFFKDKNNGFIAFNSTSNLDTNIIYTNDGGETSKIRYYSNYFRTGFKSFPLSYRGRNLLISSGSYSHGWWTLVFDITDSLTSQRQDNFPHHQLFCAFADGDNIYALGKDSSAAANLYAVYVSQDTGRTWQEHFTFETESGFASVVPDIKTNYDGAFFASWFKPEYGAQDTTLRQYLYRIDVPNKTARVALNKTADGLNSPFKIYDKYYVPYYTFKGSDIATEVQYTEDITTEPVVWKEAKSGRYGTPVFRYRLGDTTFAVTAYDSLMGSSSLFLAKIKEPNGVAEPLQFDASSAISITGPFASSVEGEYSFSVSWSEQANMDKPIFAAYDTRGERVSSEFRFVPLSANSGELTWRPSAIAREAYIITVKAGAAVGAVTVIAD